MDADFLELEFNLSKDVVTICNNNLLEYEKIVDNEGMCFLMVSNWTEDCNMISDNPPQSADEYRIVETLWIHKFENTAKLQKKIEFHCYDENNKPYSEFETISEKEDILSKLLPNTYAETHKWLTNKGFK